MEEPLLGSQTAAVVYPAWQPPERGKKVERGH